MIKRHKAKRVSKTSMHPDLLERYFNVECWHADVFTALLHYRRVWLWSELDMAFMNLCCHLNTPKGSASLTAEWINHFIRLGWAKATKIEGDPKAYKIERGLLKSPRRWLMKAIAWSEARTVVERQNKQERDAIWKRLEQTAEDDHQTRLAVLAQLDQNDASKAAALDKLRFRLAGRKIIYSNQ